MAPARLVERPKEVPSKKHYIPVGSLSISKDDSGIPDEQWVLADSTAWISLDDFSYAPDPSTDSSTNAAALKCLNTLVLRVPSIKPIARLVKERWIRLEYRVFKESGHVAIRVYILPDDLDRRILERWDPKLRKARQTLLHQLDFSREAWTGEYHSYHCNRVSSPLSGDPDANDLANRSLLELFNNIPSPDPSPEVITDPDALDAMYSLLESNVAGLTSTLYTYQRRSAALMLQRETNPDKVIDPRLVPVLDQEGGRWYLDQASGVVLKEPRYYDGILGGVLAEEMGSGKTIICLGLILATKHLYSIAPDLYRGNRVPVRKKVGSLADMAAACAARYSIPWQPTFKGAEAQHGYDYTKCTQAVERNPGTYSIPAEEPRRSCRRQVRTVETESRPEEAGSMMYISKTNLVVVPNNLVRQWQQEIEEHTEGLEVLTITRKSGIIPDCVNLLKYDIILFAQTKFETMEKNGALAFSPLAKLHFKRCIVDEGHTLGNSKIGVKSNLLLGLERLHFSSRWIVTGTPAQGLFGVDGGKETNGDTGMENSTKEATPERNLSSQQETQDLKRLHSIASLYLKVRPWANTINDAGDTVANWAVYVMQPQHSTKSSGRRDCLRATLNSLIIRHRLSEVKPLLPLVDEKVVLLDGSYQDKLSLNIFAMMIIFNSVQSQRTDQDYFFHPKQKRALHELLHNLRQASFFGGSFYSDSELAQAIATAEEFLEKKKVPISTEDDTLLREAIAFGHLARKNEVRKFSNMFHEMPLYVSDFPGASGEAWSLDSKGGDLICSAANMLAALQKLIRSSLDNPTELNALLNGRLFEAGKEEKQKALLGADSAASSTQQNRSTVLAGNTRLGDAGIPGKGRTLTTPTRRKEKSSGKAKSKDVEDREIPPALATTKVLSTVSAKLSYLVDSIVKYQVEEQILVFYDNENVAYYIAAMLDLLQIQHLIYAKSLTTERKCQYVNSFNYNPQFRVLLMDTTQAAFGLDMRAASRIYFMSPVLNPQVEAQAIGRARRISQEKPVTVETLVLRDSLEEIIVSRKKKMTQAEHRSCKSILDDRPIYNWILNVKIVPLPEEEPTGPSQMVSLQTPQLLFGKGFGRILSSDEGLVTESPQALSLRTQLPASNGVKRPFDTGPGGEASSSTPDTPSKPPKKRAVRFAVDSDEE